MRRPGYKPTTRLHNIITNFMSYRYWTNQEMSSLTEITMFHRWRNRKAMRGAWAPSLWKWRGVEGWTPSYCCTRYNNTCICTVYAPSPPQKHSVSLKFHIPTPPSDHKLSSLWLQTSDILPLPPTHFYCPFSAVAFYNVFRVVRSHTFNKCNWEFHIAKLKFQMTCVTRILIPALSNFIRMLWKRYVYLILLL